MFVFSFAWITLAVATQLQQIFMNLRDAGDKSFNKFLQIFGSD
jgi:hypothetical protein